MLNQKPYVAADIQLSAEVFINKKDNVDNI